MSIVTAVVFSMLLLTVTGCATSSPPPAAKQETGKKARTPFVMPGTPALPVGTGISFFLGTRTPSHDSFALM